MPPATASLASSNPIWSTSCSRRSRSCSAYSPLAGPCPGEAVPASSRSTRRSSAWFRLMRLSIVATDPSPEAVRAALSAAAWARSACRCAPMDLPIWERDRSSARSWRRWEWWPRRIGCPSGMPAMARRARRTRHRTRPACGRLVGHPVRAVSSPLAACGVSFCGGLTGPAVGLLEAHRVVAQGPRHRADLRVTGLRPQVARQVPGLEPAGPSESVDLQHIDGGGVARVVPCTRMPSAL
jgi:hypothetical protein